MSTIPRVPLRVVDAGARYGLHPTWSGCIEIAEFDLYEVEPDEFARLTMKYADRPTVRVFDTALHSSETELVFKVRSHRGLTSSFSPSAQAQSEGYKTDEFSTTSTFTAQSATLDDIYPNGGVHFLKLDVEGGEAHVIEGAQRLLSTSVQGVRSEVCFSPVIEGGPLFGDVDAALRARGFQLLNLDYDGRGAARNAFTRLDKYGRLLSTDAVWIRPLSELLQAPPQRSAENVIRQSLFLLQNGASDLSVEALTEAANLGLPIADYAPSALFRLLRHQLGLLFKELLSSPHFTADQVSLQWEMLFREPFPLMNSFWETHDHEHGQPCRS